MRRIWIVAVALCCVMFIGCQADDITDKKMDPEGVTSLTVSLIETRTMLGDRRDNGRYPTYWSQGDCIVVNGVTSEEAEINSEAPHKATFKFDEVVDYPYNITYPYCESTSTDSPKVYFPSEQSYVDNTFSEGCAPMCGYVARRGDNIELKHLAGLLRFSIKAESEGVKLSKVVITSTSGAKLSGHFVVNCKNTTIVAEDSALNSVTYLLPTNFALSTTDERVIYISLPAVETGVCSLEFIDSNGDKMVFGWNSKSIKAGVVREFATISYVAGNVASLDGFEEEDDVIITNSACGYVRDEEGNPIEGVAVSDGFTIVTTKSDGYYELDASSDTWYIYITVPAEYEIPIKDDQPGFYQKYEPRKYRYDFTLQRLAEGKEKKFALFVLGDPQVADQKGMNRLRDEALPAIKAHSIALKAQGIPCYGITLGDLISNNNSADRSSWRDDVFDCFAYSNAGMPVFHVMGNHDHTYFNAMNPLIADHRSSTIELKAQRAHEEVFGPVNFSFDRGDMHIISMRNVMYNRNDDCSAGLRRAFLKEQYEWLKQDLALVPKDKSVILCVHIPFQDGGGSYVDMTRDLINRYKEAHIMSGHSHLIQAIEGAKQKNIYEHNMGALCGAWWTSYMCGDGSPSGFGVFVSEGTTFTDWYHLGYDAISKNRSHQMRLYRGNALTGTAISGTNSNATKGYYAFNFDEDILLANVYMADSKWTVKVYEDGVYSGDMTHISLSTILTDEDYYARPKIYLSEATTPSADGKGYGYMIGDGSIENPYISTVPTAGDIYASGYINGVRGYADHTIGSNSQCYHMYMYKLKNKEAQIKVEATDRFGNIYSETKITKGTDYSSILY